MNIYYGIYETLGDCIVTTAILRTIMEKYKDKSPKITLCCSKAYTDVFHNNPDVAEILPANSVGEVVLRSVEKPYDKVYLPLQLTPEHNAWHQFPPFVLPPKEGEFHNLVDYYASRCQDDLKVTKRETYMYPEDSHWEEILNNIPDQHKEHFANTPFITLHTTSRNVSKDWPYNNFAQLAAKIKEKYGDKLEVYQIGGENDKALPKPCIPLMGIPILATAAVLKRSLLHIDNDSGPSFISTSVGTKTIVIYGATTAQSSGPLFNMEAIEPNRHCLDRIHVACHTQCRIAPQCIDSVSVDEVFEVVCRSIDEKLNS